MAIIKDLPKEKRDEYFKRAADAGLKVPNLFLWTEETFEKKIAELTGHEAAMENEQKNKSMNETTEDVNKTTENVNKITENVNEIIQKANETKAENAKLCHICKIPIINGKCLKCGEVYGDN